MEQYIAKVTEIMREADQLFQTTGGSTRHYVRDLLLPMFEQAGLKIVDAEPSPAKAEQEEERVLRNGLEALQTAINGVDAILLEYCRINNLHNVPGGRCDLLNHLLSGPKREQEELRWVKATMFNYKPNSRYYARWGDGDGAIKSTGWFQQSDGTFFWNENGFVPVLKKEHDQLYILDESTPPVNEAGQPRNLPIEELIKLSDEELNVEINKVRSRLGMGKSEEAGQPAEQQYPANWGHGDYEGYVMMLQNRIKELESRQQPAGESGWISIEDKPLYIDTALGWECTEDGEKDFIAAVPYWDTKGERKLCWWIRHCCFEDGTGLCVVGDDENIPAGWHRSAITHWKPWPAHPEQLQNNKP